MAEEVSERYCTNAHTPRRAGGNGDPGPLALPETGGGDPWRTQRPWSGQVSWSLIPPPGVLCLWGRTLGEELETKEASSTLPGPEIPEKLNLIMP